MTRKRAPGRVLNERHATFVQAYFENGFNATRAYESAYPDAKLNTCATEGWRLLRTPKVAAVIRVKLSEHWKKIGVDGDEVLGRVMGDATADLSQMFGEDGRMLRPADWPESIRNSVESFEQHKNGFRVKLASKTSARRTLLEVTGKVKTTVGTLDELAAAIRGDIAKHAKDEGTP